MYRKFLISAFLIISIIFSFSICLANDATNMLEDAGNNIRNAIGNVENGVEGAAKDASNTSKDATENMTQKANNIGNELMDNNSGDDYTATRVATDTANSNSFMGMDANAWTWLIVGITAIAIIALIWYYTMQLRSSNNNNDHRD